MSEIKQINTGVAELLAVKVPEGAHTFEVDLGIESYHIFYYVQIFEALPIKLPEGNWQIVGIADQLTEEQYAGLVERLWDYYKNYLAPKDGNVGNYKRLVCYKAKEAFASLMQANEVYSKNPYYKNVYPFPGADWVKAEANTGTWLILKRLS